VKLTTHLHLVQWSRTRGPIPPLPLYVFMAWCLVKHRNNFTFLPCVSFQRIRPSARHCVIFRNEPIFYGKDLAVPHPIPNLEVHPSSAVRGCLFNIFAATIHISRSCPPFATYGRVMPSLLHKKQLRQMHGLVSYEFCKRTQLNQNTTSDWIRIKLLVHASCGLPTAATLSITDQASCYWAVSLPRRAEDSRIFIQPTARSESLIKVPEAAGSTKKHGIVTSSI
jgi:hypothetical protein